MAPAALNRGVLRYAEGRYGAAIDDFRRALDAGADPAVAHYNLALAYRALGDRAEARDSVARALRIAPDHAEARRLERRLAAEP